MSRRLSVLVALATLALPVSAAGAATSRIVNGEPTAAADLPFMAGLEIALEGDGDESADALCGGSLIAARWIVTAAHCLAENAVDVGNSFAVIGATNLNAATDDQRYRWAETFVPSGYANGNGGFDMGLVRLARPAPGQQLRLLRSRDSGLFGPGTSATTAGWGFTEDQTDGGMLSTSQLRAVALNIVSDLECSNAFRSAGQSGDALDFATEICAIAPDRDSCNGDSGGPLFVDTGGGEPGLVGSVSFGIGNGELLRGDRSCNEGPPGVYAKVAGEALNTFVRDRVPQVELATDVAVPVPGGAVTFTAEPRAPGGSGPFGGYDTLSWDLDGDNDFDERRGQRTATVKVPEAGTTVAVLATTAAGDAEVRRLRVVPQAKSSVSFASRKVRVRAGRSVGVRIARVGTGAGSATLSVAGRGVSPKRRTVSFSGNEPAKTVRLRVKRGGARTATLKLTGFGGDVVAGTRTSASLKVRASR